MSSAASMVSAKTDLVVEILSWLPPKSIIRFKQVCKQWHNLTSTPFFVATHARRVPHRVSGFVFQDDSCSMKIYNDDDDGDGDGVSLFFTESCTLRNHKTSFLLHSCNGLVLLREHDPWRRSSRLVVYNPTTKRYRILPNAENGDKYFAPAFGPSRSTDYTVILACRRSGEIKVYSSEKQHSWETFSVQAPTPWNNSSTQWHSCCCDGVMYWINDGDGSLISLDIERRSVAAADTKIRPPMHENHRIVKFYESRTRGGGGGGGRLVLFRSDHVIYSDVTVEILEMSTNDESGWLLLHKVWVMEMMMGMCYKRSELGAFPWRKFCEVWMRMAACSLLVEWEEEEEEEGDELIVSLDGKRVVAYNFTSETHEVLLSNPEHGGVHVLDSYTSTLVSP